MDWQNRPINFPLTVPLILALVYHDADDRIKHVQSAKTEYKLQHPCPATGTTTGPLEDYVIDHIAAPACDSGDAPSNMQWQLVAEEKTNDN